VIYKERSVLTFGVISSLLLSYTLFSGLMPITSLATTSPSCPDLPTDGRPQPKKGANADSKTWKAVPMRDDPSLFKVVDSSGINVADRFRSKTNAEQYIAHYVCVTSPTPSPTPTPTPSPTPTPTKTPPQPVELPRKCADRGYSGVLITTCAQVLIEPTPTAVVQISAIGLGGSSQVIYDDKFVVTPEWTEAYRGMLGGNEVSMWLIVRGVESTDDPNPPRLELDINKVCTPVCELKDPPNANTLITWPPK
jgi:hypothetical protein